MTTSYRRPLLLTRRVLRVLTILNLVLGAGILVLLLASLVIEGPFMEALKVDPGATRVAGLRAIMLLGLTAVAFSHLILTSLTAVVDTVADGDPFVAGNADRLRSIAWAMLGLELINLGVGLTAFLIATPARPVDIDWDPSLTRWLAILLCFVLANVFTQGTAMRDELEGTV